MTVNSPNLYLFAYQIYKASNLDNNDFDAEKDFLWKNADAIVNKILKQDLHLNQKIDVNKLGSGKVDLLSEIIDDNPSLEFKGEISVDNSDHKIPVEGFAHPLRFSDSYCLSFNIGIPEKKDDGTEIQDIDIDIFRKLNPDNCLTLTTSKSTFLGQTLLITAKITNSQTNFRDIADEYLKKLFPDTYNIPLYNSQGYLFKSPIIEYGLFNQITNYQHVLVWLFTDDETEKKFQDNYSEIVDLLLFRTKAIYAFKNSREIYKELNKVCREIEDEIDNLPQPEENQSSDLATDANSINNTINDAYLTDINSQLIKLQKLKNKLKNLPHLNLKYIRLIRNLEEYKNTIAIHSDNYEKRGQQILEKISSETSDTTLATKNIEFLQRFYQKSCPYFKDQIEADLGYFRPASGLLERAVDTIRGIVEIEQAEINQRKEVLDKIRDAKLQNTIQSVGLGVGVGAGVAGIFSQSFTLIKDIDEKEFVFPSFRTPDLPTHPLVISLILSLSFGLVSGFFVWFISRCILDKKVKKMEKQEQKLLSVNNSVNTNLPS
jgi:hypothetical protein